MGMLNKAKQAAPAEQSDDDDVVDQVAPEETPSAEPDGDEGAVPAEASDDDEGGEDMPASLQPEYKRVVAALYQVLYQNEQTSRNVLESLDPSDQGKIESVAKTTMLIMHQLDEKLDMQGDVIPYVLLTIVDRLIELLERAKKVKFSDEEIMQTCSVAFDGAKSLIPNESSAPDAGADTDTAGSEPGAVPPGAAEAAPAPAEAPEATPTEEEVA